MFGAVFEGTARNELLREHITSDLLRFLGEDVYDGGSPIQRSSTSASALSNERTAAASENVQETTSHSSGYSLSRSCDPSSGFSFSRSREHSSSRESNAAEALHERLLNLLDRPRAREEQQQRERSVYGHHSDDDSQSEDNTDNPPSLDAGSSKTARVVALLTVSALLAPWLLFAALYLSGEITELPGSMGALLVGSVMG